MLIPSRPPLFFFFFFNDTAPAEIYTLSLHDALPISPLQFQKRIRLQEARSLLVADAGRSEEHTSELQSRQYLGCRLLLEKKKKTCAMQSSRWRPTRPKRDTVCPRGP